MYNHEDLDPHPFYKTFLIYYRFIIKGNDICKIEKVNVWQSGSMLCEELDPLTNGYAI